MHDLIIREGNVVDGSGAPARVADIAVSDGIVAELGGKLGRARREIDAQGYIVTPGVVDVHTSPHHPGTALPLQFSATAASDLHRSDRNSLPTSSI